MPSSHSKPATLDSGEFKVLSVFGLLFGLLAWADWNGWTWLSTLTQALFGASWAAFMLRLLYLDSRRILRVHAILAAALVASAYVISSGQLPFDIDMPWVSRWQCFLSYVNAYAPPVVATTELLSFGLHFVLRDDSFENYRDTWTIFGCKVASVGCLLLAYAAL